MQVFTCIAPFTFTFPFASLKVWKLWSVPLSRPLIICQREFGFLSLKQCFSCCKATISTISIPYIRECGSKTMSSIIGAAELTTSSFRFRFYADIFQSRALFSFLIHMNGSFRPTTSICIYGVSVHRIFSTYILDITIVFIVPVCLHCNLACCQKFLFLNGNLCHLVRLLKT